MGVGVLVKEGETEEAMGELVKTTGTPLLFSQSIYWRSINQSIIPAKSRMDVDGFKVILHTTDVTLSPTVRRR